jgi:short-subunit dehydrogenase
MTTPLRVFITGASSGLGEALARRYAAQGAIVGVFARREAELARVAASLAPAHVATYTGDVRDAAALAAAADDFVARHGLPDVVIANAGVSRGTLTEKPQDFAAFKAVLDTNVTGMVATFMPFAAAMQRARHGTLVGIASVAGFRGLAGSGAYSASKAAAIAYLESLRLEMRPFGVAVVTICPGYVATPMTARNPYRMPFLMKPDAAAAKIVRIIARRRRFRVVPLPMAMAGTLLRHLPRPLYDALFVRAGRKPRSEDDPAAESVRARDRG